MNNPANPDPTIGRIQPGENERWKYGEPTLHGQFVELERHMPPALFPPPARLRLVEVAERLPASLVGELCFECPLGRGGGYVDLAVAVEPNTISGLRGTTANQRDSAISRFRFGRLVVGLVNRCNTAVLRNGDVLRALYLAYDLREPTGSDHANPGVYMHLNNTAIERPAEAADAALGALIGTPIPDVTSRIIRRCIDALPANAYVPHVAHFPGRHPWSVRLSIHGMRQSDVPSFLEQIGWPGSTAHVDRVLEGLTPAGTKGWPSQPAGLLLDIADDVLDRLGFEFPVNGYRRFGGELHAMDFLQRLVSRNLCTAEQLDAMIRWPGLSFDSSRSCRNPTVVLRTVNHIKLVYRSNRPIAVKAYLFVAPGRVAVDPGIGPISNPGPS